MLEIRNAFNDNNGLYSLKNMFYRDLSVKMWQQTFSNTTYACNFLNMQNILRRGVTGHPAGQLREKVLPLLNGTARTVSRRGCRLSPLTRLTGRGSEASSSQSRPWDRSQRTLPLQMRPLRLLGERGGARRACRCG